MPYVTSSASMRMSDGCALLIAGVEPLDVDAAELRREALLQPRIEEAPERQAAADEVLPEPALRLVDAERRVLADRQVRVLARQLVRVEPVPVLVHRREERLQLVAGSSAS